MAWSRVCRWLALLISLLLLESSCRPAAGAIEGVDNVFTYWNAVTQKVVRTLGLPNQISARTYLFVHLPQYKALQLAYQAGFPYPEAAADYSAHYVLSTLFPAQQSPSFDGAIAKRIYPLNLSASDDSGARQIGYKFAVPFLRNRIFDGSQIWVPFQPAPYGSVGQYQFTPNQTYTLYPQLGTTKPIVIKSPKDFDKYGGPPKIPSAEYDANYNVSVTIGNANSPLQTQFQKDTARFWEAGANTSGIVGQLFNASLAATGPNITLNDTAKIFTKLSVAHYDGSIAGWYQKYEYLNWRPISAIREGDPSHAPVPSFATYINTPPHPEYPSTHSVNAGAFLAVLADYFGLPPANASSPNGPFVIATEGYLLPNRTYTSLTVVADEIGQSRVYGGIHFLKSIATGTQLGIDVAEYDLSKFVKQFGDL